MELTQLTVPLDFALARDAARGGQLACLILAHNEAEVIGGTVRSIRSAIGPADTVFVVTDHCEDDTAEQARQSGATVLIRAGGTTSGKGAALAWFMRAHWETVRECAALLVLDADSRLDQAAGPALMAHVGDGRAYQCRVEPAGYEGSPLATLIALSEILEQSIYDTLRSRLGWPVRLRGTGMLLPPALLQKVCNELDTEVEDVALSLLLAASGTRIFRLEGAVVYDPKPRQPAAAARQRARWFRGQWAALWRYRGQVLRVALQGPRGWSLLGALFLKPRWLVSAAAILLALACRPWPWAAGLMWGAVLLQCIALGAALLRLGAGRSRFLSALLHFPSFALMWMRGFGLMFRRSPWLRVRDR